MDDFPGNSNREREAVPKPPKANTAPQKNVKQITKGEARRRKRPLGTRVKEMFFGGGDARSVWGYVFGEVLVPAMKDMVADATTQAVERAVFGEARRGPRGWRQGNSSPIGHVRYDGYSRGGSSAPWRSGPPQREMSQQSRARHNFDEIILDSRGEAEEVLDMLFEIVKEYGVASVADLYAMVGITSAYTDQKYGWSNLPGASVQHIRGGQYLLNLPRPEPLD